jgi:hypothetical protein
MLPLLPFAAGLIAGAAVVKIAKNDKTKANLDKAQNRLKEATVNGLTVIEQSSAKLRGKLTAEAPVASAETGPDAEEAPALLTPEAETQP